MHGVTSSTVYQMVPISKNGKKQEHQTINFFNIKRLSYIYLITAQPPLNDTNGDTTLSSKQLWTPSLQSLLIHVDCMLISTGMNVEAPYSRAKDQMEKNAEMYRSKPDIIIRETNCITVIELTCPFEKNLLKSHDYKITKYQNPAALFLILPHISSWYSLRFPVLILPDLH